MIIWSAKTINIFMQLEKAMSNILPPNTFSRLVVIPVPMGLGHLAPAIGAIRTATGTYQFPVALLGMIAAGAALVDCKSKLIRRTHNTASYLCSNHSPLSD
jgi:hypothetical protein